jgi:hypothetical protein
MKTKITIAGQELEYLGTDQHGSWYNFLNPEILTTIMVRPNVSLRDAVVKAVQTFGRARHERLRELGMSGGSRHRKKKGAAFSVASGLSQRKLY